MSKHFTQIAIIGGGICGLWLLNLLRRKGYDAWLFEKDRLGSEQTLASQGMIHGGLKYALGGFVTPSSETIANMPNVWKACLHGDGPVDLSDLGILSSEYFLFSDGALSSKVTAFFASKSLQGRITSLEQNQYPEVFQNPRFQGRLYQLQDIVLDVTSLLKRLTAANKDFIFQGAPEVLTTSNKVTGLLLTSEQEVVADRYVFAAGAGNEALMADIGQSKTKMQLRPLQQVMLKGDLPAIFAHAVSLKSLNRPRLTLTSYPVDDDKMVWYLGGDLAERSVGKSADEVIDSARAEINDLLPWINLNHIEWATLNIDRAEPALRGNTRPDSPYIEAIDNCIVCWPIKMTLVPMLGDIVLAQLGLEPAAQSSPVPQLPSAPLAKTPWETAFAG